MAVTPDTDGATEAANEVESSRADVASAFDEVAAREDTPQTVEQPERKPDAEQKSPASSGSESPERAGRDAAGRFTPKTAAPSEAPAVSGAAQPAAPAPKPEAVTRFPHAPASWAPQESAHWDKTPAEVREAIMRRESEVQRTMQEAANARNGLAALQQTIQPYVPNINAANGGDVIGAIKTFFDYDNRLRHGSQIEKAKAISGLIRGYGIDIATLDNELAGAQHAPEQQQQQALQEALQRELKPFRDYMARQESQAQEGRQLMAREVSEGISEFAADPKHKHFETVRGDMADLLEIASSQNRILSLDDAYDRACWQNGQVRTILLAEQASAVGRSQHQAAQRAHAAAVGVRNAPRAGAPAQTVPQEKRTRSDDIAAAFAHHAGEE